MAAAAAAAVWPPWPGPRVAAAAGQMGALGAQPVGAAPTPTAAASLPWSGRSGGPAGPPSQRRRPGPVAIPAGRLRIVFVNRPSHFEPSSPSVELPREAVRRIVGHLSLEGAAVASLCDRDLYRHVAEDRRWALLAAAGDAGSAHARACRALNCADCGPSTRRALRAHLRLASAAPHLLDAFFLTPRYHAAISADLRLGATAQAPAPARLIQLMVEACEGRSTCMHIAAWSARRLPSSIGQLTALVTLRVSACPRLAALPQHISLLVNLRELALAECDGLRQLPAALGQLSQLTSLQLSECPRVQLPAEIGGLRALRWLHLSECEALTHLPDTAVHLLSLRELTLIDCHNLAGLPSVLTRLQSLTALELIGCPSLTCGLEKIDALSALRHLNLDVCATGLSAQSERRLRARGCLILRSTYYDLCPPPASA